MFNSNSLKPANWENSGFKLPELSLNSFWLLLPKWFILPTTWKAHGGSIYVWIFGKQSVKFSFHVIAG
jgi:hypothetical protein